MVKRGQWPSRGKFIVINDLIVLRVAQQWQRHRATQLGCFAQISDGRGRTLPTNHCLCEKTRVIALSCGIKISAVHCLVLSQSTRVTDGRTDRRTDGQNYDSQDRASIAASCGKMSMSIKNFSVAKIAKLLHRPRGLKNALISKLKFKMFFST